MARHHAGKARRKAVPARDGRRRRKTSATATPEQRLRERLVAAERERDWLKGELERLQAHNRKLEEVSTVACDRITWALETLHSILEAKR